LEKKFKSLRKDFERGGKSFSREAQIAQDLIGAKASWRELSPARLVVARKLIVRLVNVLKGGEDIGLEEKEQYVKIRSRSKTIGLIGRVVDKRKCCKTGLERARCTPPPFFQEEEPGRKQERECQQRPSPVVNNSEIPADPFSNGEQHQEDKGGRKPTSSQEDSCLSGKQSSSVGKPFSRQNAQYPNSVRQQNPHEVSQNKMYCPSYQERERMYSPQMNGWPEPKPFTSPALPGRGGPSLPSQHPS